MITIRTVQEKKGVDVELIGVIDGPDDLKELENWGKSDLLVDCRQVVRINSVGLRAWRNCFDRLRKRGVRIKFVDLAPVLVNQTAFLADLVYPYECVSIIIPFLCAQCDTDVVRSCPVENLKSMDLKNPTETCAKCGGEMSMDENPDHYFSIFTR